ncbi:MAG: LytTR family DNA-binding domain-containing protein [Bacteroidetes bacterium]|nr:LytTR family DNA-binding domain-containing protein [Bacteroidota bacterium]
MSIKAIIIDDEQPAREIIRNFVKEHDEIEILTECSDGFSALKAINELKPDLVFLDIQMPKLTGFELLELLEEPPVVIFITAYDQYAIKAFDMNAADYLLKPYTKARFEAALQKALLSLKSDKKSDPVKNVLATHDDQPDILQRIAVKSGHKIHVVPVEEIIYIGAEGDYVMIYTKDNHYLKEKTMKYMESHLDPAQFVRIHRSSIVNIGFIARMEIYDKENYAILLKNNTNLKASISGYRLLKQILQL